MSAPVVVAIAPEFEVLSATARRHAAVPAIDFDVHVSEPSGREVYAIAREVVEELEARWTARLGAARMRELRALLEELNAAL